MDGIRHLIVPELGTQAIGLGELNYVDLPSVGDPVIWDFENKSSKNAKISLEVSLNISIENMPDGATGNLYVTMGPNGNESLTFTGLTTRNGQSSALLNRDPGSVTFLRIIKNGATLSLHSTSLTTFSQTTNGLVPSTEGTTLGDVLTRTGWGKVGRNSMSADFDEFYLHRENHIGYITSNFVIDFNDAVRTNPINLLAPPTGNLNMNMKRIVNLADPEGPNDAVNAVYVSDAITSIDALLFNQVFS